MHLRTPGRSRALRPLLLCLALCLAACAPNGPATSGPEDLELSSPDEIRAVDPSPLPPTARGLRPRYGFADADQFPEGGAYDPQDNAFYVGSMEHGGVVRMAADGSESAFVPAVTPGREVSLGMTVDTARRRLWVCAVDHESLAGTVSVYDLATRATLRRYDLTADTAGLPAGVTRASCNDIALDARGDAYVTDRENPHIYRVAFDGDGPALWARDPRLRPSSRTVTVGMNGIAFTPDRSALIVTVLNPAQLIRVALDDPREVTPLSLYGASFSAGAYFLNGPDGIAFYQGALYVAFGNVVMRVTADSPAWTRARVQRLSGFSGLTAVIVADDALYGLTGEAVRWVLHIPFARPFLLTRIDPGWFH